MPAADRLATSKLVSQTYSEKPLRHSQVNQAEWEKPAEIIWGLHTPLSTSEKN